MDERTDDGAGGRRALRILSRRSLPGREALPLALLLLALSSVFAFGGDRSQFYRGVDSRGASARPDFISAQTLTLAANLSAEHRFLGFSGRRLDRQGEPQYDPYNRFPIGSHGVVGLAILPFGDDFPRQIMAARLLMLAFFAAAAVFAYLALVRLIGHRWIAVAATLLAFSSYYTLYHSDMVSSEVASLFGVMLVFHGMVVHAQDGRFRQLFARTAVALLLGWHVAGLVAPFVLLGLGSELLRARRDGGGGAAVRSRSVRRYAVYGAFSALWALLLVGFNLGNEYLAFGGEVPLTELPSFESTLTRTGFDAGGLTRDWASLLRALFGGVGGMAIPFALVDRLGLDMAQRSMWTWPAPAAAPQLAALGVAAAAACAAGLLRLPCRRLFATLLLAGPCWAIPLRGSFAHHEFEAMFLVGFPLVLYALALLGLRRLIGLRRAGHALPALALAAGAAFALSAWDMARVNHDAEASRRQGEIASDYRGISRIVAGRSVVDPPIPLGAAPSRHFYLAGSFRQFAPIWSEAGWRRASGLHDFVILTADLGVSLTPRNRRFHLYRPAALDAVRASYAAREPSLRAAYDLYLEGRTLTAVRDPCHRDDAGPPFFLETATSGAPGGERRDLAFGEHGASFGGACMARFELPDGPLAGVRVGQLGGGGLRLWEASLPVEDASFPRGASTWRDATAAEPSARGPFDVYRDGRALTFVREECGRRDAEDRFFVHVYDAGGAREGLDFWFHERGARWDGACVAAAELPDYEVRSVRTGQYDETGHLWDEEFALDAGAWLARFEAAAAPEPALRAEGFGLRLDGRSLTFVREACGAEDIEDRFFVHVHPADGGGREAINFWFRERGLRHGDRCMASVELPEYGIDRVVTGQYDASGHLWEAELAVGEASE